MTSLYIVNDTARVMNLIISFLSNRGLCQGYPYLCIKRALCFLLDLSRKHLFFFFFVPFREDIPLQFDAFLAVMSLLLPPSLD